MATRGDGTGTLGKAMDVVDAVAAAENPPRFVDLLARLGQPRGTLHRHIGNLLAEGLLSQRNDGTYELGLRLLSLASRMWSASSFRAVARPHLELLHEATGETVHLAMLRGRDVVYLDKVEGRQAVRMHSQVGSSSPAHCTGVGKAALSALPPDDLQRWLAVGALPRFTPRTITQPDALLAELMRVRDEGVAFDREEHEPGIACVAAAILSGTPEAAAVSATAPSYRLPAGTLDRWAVLVRETADAIARDVRFRLGPHS